MSNISNSKELISEYKTIYQTANKILKTLVVIPNQYLLNKNDYKFINRVIHILTSFLELKIITHNDIKSVTEVIAIANQETIFNYYLLKIEKEFCNREFNKYLENPTNYEIPNLEVFIDNGEFLKLYIEYKIDMHKEQITKENKEKGKALSKTI